MTMVEFVGYVAASLVFATFCMKTMIPLRIVGITSNLTFIVYSWLAGVVPLFVLHSALLPLSIWRLMQIRVLVREVRKAALGDLPLEGLLPFMSPRRAEAGEILFRRGDAADAMFHLLRAPSGWRSSARGSGRAPCWARSACSPHAASAPPRPSATPTSSCFRSLPPRSCSSTTRIPGSGSTSSG